MAEQLEKLEGVITIVNFVISNNGKETLTLVEVKERKKTEIPPGKTHTFDSAGPYLGYIDEKIAFELFFREGSLIVNRGKALSDGGKILITATLT